MTENKPKVTACLITWKRPANILTIISYLMSFDFIDEIILHDNSKGENIINYGRYVSALRAKNYIIYTQDDDCMINNLRDVYNKFIEDPTCISHSGPDYYEKDIPNNIFGDTQMSLMGWGSFFKKEWISVLDQYTQKFGQDYCFYRETDRIFSILLGKHSNFTLGDMVQFSESTGDMALCNQPDHLQYKKLSIERALEIYETQRSHSNIHN